MIVGWLAARRPGQEAIVPEIDEYADDQQELAIIKVGGQAQDQAAEDDTGDGGPGAVARNLMEQGQS